MSTHPFSLPENITIARVQPLHEQLKNLLSRVGDDGIALEAAAVQRVDTSGVQLLYGFVAAARAQGVQVLWQHPSAKLCDAANTLGLASELGIVEPQR